MENTDTPFKLGKIIKKSCRLSLKLLTPLYGLHLLLSLPLIAFAFIGPIEANQTFFSFYPLCSGYVLTVISIKVTSHLYQNQSFQWRDVLKFSIQKYGKFLLLNFLFSFAIGLGVLCAVIPGLILSLALFFSAPLFLLEETSIKETWNRSWDMSEGIKWRLTGYLFAIISLFIAVLIASFFVLFIELSLLYGTVGTEPFIFTQILIHLSPIVLFVPLSSAFITVAYFSRKKEMEENPQTDPIPVSG